MRHLWILDNGHNKNTPGKRSPFYDGVQLFEYEFTRDIVQRIAELLRWAGIEYRVLVKPEEVNVSLSERVRRANAWGSNAIYVSIHANAGGGTGYEVFTSPGQTKSDDIATVFLDSFASVFPEARKRTDISDGDQDKEAEFTVLTDTFMPAILTECFFMDNKAECQKILMTDEGRQLIAMAHYQAIAQIEKRGI